MVHKLDHWSSIYEGSEKFIKMAIRLNPRISGGKFFLSATSFHPSDKLTIYSF